MKNTLDFQQQKRNINKLYKNLIENEKIKNSIIETGDLENCHNAYDHSDNTANYFSSFVIIKVDSAILGGDDDFIQIAINLCGNEMYDMFIEYDYDIFKIFSINNFSKLERMILYYL